MSRKSLFSFLFLFLQTEKSKQQVGWGCRWYFEYQSFQESSLGQPFQLVQPLEAVPSGSYSLLKFLQEKKQKKQKNKKTKKQKKKKKKKKKQKKTEKRRAPFFHFQPLVILTL
jgi:hypothetical protein